MDKIDPGKAYLLLESGPIVLVTTHHRDHANVMTMVFQVPL
jgi:flavin reductase (DIM6/NTAB) family NADH-FMN oxidoreductase RutF